MCMDDQDGPQIYYVIFLFCFPLTRVLFFSLAETAREMLVFSFPHICIKDVKSRVDEDVL